MSVSLGMLVGLMLVYPALMDVAPLLKFFVFSFLLSIFLFTLFLILPKICRVFMYEHFPKHRRQVIIE